jgi:TonB family protein
MVAGRAFAAAALLAATAPCTAQTAVPVTTPTRLDQKSCALPSTAHRESPAWERPLVLRLRVAASGQIAAASVQQSSGDAAYNERVAEAILRCRAQPATRDGQAVDSEFNLRVNLRAASNPSIAVAVSCVPVYPMESVLREEAGTTVLQFQIDERGEATGVNVERSSGHERLDDAAAAALKRCTFRPGRDAEGRPIASTLRVEYVWKLQ